MIELIKCEFVLVFVCLARVRMFYVPADTTDLLVLSPSKAV